MTLNVLTKEEKESNLSFLYSRKEGTIAHRADIESFNSYSNKMIWRISILNKKRLILIAVILILMLAFFFKYESQLVFIKYLPSTVSQSMNFMIDEYSVCIPLHKGTYIKDFDIGLKPSIKYFSPTSKKEIISFYDDMIEHVMKEKNYISNETGNICIYFNEDNNKYVLVPLKYNIINEDKFIRQVLVSLIDKKEIRQMIDRVNLIRK